jgi:chorismate mutase
MLMSGNTQNPALGALREEMDGIDGKLLDLLGRRFSLTEQIKALKNVQGSQLHSALRPAREMEILRRLVSAAVFKDLDPAFVVRLWRTIIAESGQRQSSTTIHIGRKLSATLGNRLRIRDHFGTMSVEEWKDEAQALMQVNASPRDLCVVEADGNWVGPMIEGKSGAARVIASLPVIREGEAPKLLVIGQAANEPTGQDETLLITQGNLPRDFAPQPAWQLKVGPFRLSGLPGFFSEHESPLVGLSRSNISLGLMLAGRYPSAIEV